MIEDYTEASKPEATTIPEVVEKLVETGVIDDASAISTVGDLVDQIVDMGNQKHVFAFTDSHLGLRDDMDEALLLKSIDEITEEDEDTLEYLRDESNSIIKLSTREITDSLQEDIDEDNQMRGID